MRFYKVNNFNYILLLLFNCWRIWNTEVFYNREWFTHETCIGLIYWGPPKFS